MAAIVYLATNLINGKRYIGVTTRPLDIRAREHIRPSRSTRSKLGAAIKAYGRDMFRFTTIKTCADFDEAKSEERRLVALWQPEYNMTAGGDGVLGMRHSAEMKAKWSRERKGRDAGKKRAPMSAEARKRMSEARKGKLNGLPAGWKHKPESIRKMSESQKGKPGYWKGKIPPVLAIMHERARSPEANAKRMVSMRKVWDATRRPVTCLDDQISFQSLTKAAEFYGLDVGTISQVCQRHKRHSRAGGRVFRYADDPNLDFSDVEATADQIRRNLGCKRVRCLSDGEEFESIGAAAIRYGVSKTMIRFVCVGRFATAKGHLQFKFIE